MSIDRSNALFHRLCDVGNRLEDVRDSTFPQGALWLQLAEVLLELDAVIDTLAERPAAGGCARHAAQEEETRD